MFCYSTETYLRYYVQRKDPGQHFHEISSSRIGPIPTKQELFCCVPENEIEEDILGWNRSITKQTNT